MGSVVEATDTALDRKVAIKHALSRHPDDLARFEREVKITAQLEHPSIVPIHEAGRDDDGRPFYVMRRIDGQPLSEVVARARDLPSRLALLANVLAAIDAAAYAHSRGIIHRDIKPWNILVGAHGATTLIDWGLARRIAPDADDLLVSHDGPSDGDSAELTRAGETYGTPGYMAPEQARGEPVDARADVYALGATLFHVLAGASPAEGQSPAEWIAMAATGMAPPVERIDPAAPRELVAIVAKAMAPVPDRRYVHAGELASDVRAFLAGKLVPAHRYSAGELVRRWVRRHRLAVAIAAIALVALAATGVIAIRSVVRERDRANAERDRANEEFERASLAWNRAEDRSQQLLVERASTLADHDPTRAVALLRHLPDGSRFALRARDIAQLAAAHGIARGVLLPGKQINEIAVSPDESTLAAMGEDGIIHLLDVATAKKRELARTGAWISSATWADGGATLVFNQPASIRAVDRATGQVRTLADGVRGTELWAGTTPDAVRFVDDAKHVLLEVSTRGAIRVLAEDVRYAAGDGDLTLVESNGRVRLLDGTRVQELATRPSSVFVSLAVSARLGRAAASFDGEVIEWERGGTVRGTWRVARAATLAFGKEMLFAAGHDGQVALLRPPGAVVELGRESPASLSTGATLRDGGVAFMFNTGRTWILDVSGYRRLPLHQPGARALVASARVMAASVGSEVRWWNLDHLSPRPMAAEGAKACASDATHLFVLTLNGLEAIDRRTGATRLVGDQDLFQGALVCTSIYERTISALITGPRHVLIDTESGRVHAVGDTPTLVGGVSTPFLFARGARLVERARAAGPESVRWIAPDEITWLAAAGRHAVAQTRERMYRVQLPTGSADAIGPPANAFGVDHDGRVWIARGNILTKWDGTAEREVHRFPAAIRFVLVTRAGGTGIRLEDESWWYADDAVRQVSQATVKRRFWFNERGTVLSLDPASPTLHALHLASGETMSRNFLTLSSGAIAEDGTVYALTQPAILPFIDPVPADPARLRAWIDDATNGHVDRDTDVLSWK
jgi:hypothetical protein